MPAGTLPLQFNCWACLIGDGKLEKGQDKRTEVVEMIQAGLGLMFGMGPVDMQYVQYESHICAGMVVELVGWPMSVPFLPPSKMGSGGADGLDAPWDLIHNKPCQWEDEKVSGKKRKRGENNAEEEEEGGGDGKEEGAQKKKKKKAKKAHGEEGEQEGGDEKAKKKKKKKKKKALGGRARARARARA
ncbi:hypothetical protein B0H19DRAFT_1086012 [Mycena capillaripes]|nr:hypothetical protein B0H19DRAFT_1086012 [Mycena capillaripes]